MGDNKIKIYDEDTLLVSDDAILTMKLYDENQASFDVGVAYLKDDIYLLFMGEYSRKEFDLLHDLKVGIYRIDDEDMNVVVMPQEDERDKYTYEDKISNIDPDKIIEAINTKEKILVSVPESSKIFMPTVSNDDDILKRLIKQALISKGIDLDQYRHRFENKNSLFNFKQVLRSNNNLSILLFDRGCDAMNLKYTVIIEEMDPDNVIGNKIEESILASSDDVYDL